MLCKGYVLGFVNDKREDAHVRRNVKANFTENYRNTTPEKKNIFTTMVHKQQLLSSVPEACTNKTKQPQCKALQVNKPHPLCIRTIITNAIHYEMILYTKQQGMPLGTDKVRVHVIKRNTKEYKHTEEIHLPRKHMSSLRFERPINSAMDNNEYT
jgi:hypothetical protein